MKRHRLAYEYGREVIPQPSWLPRAMRFLLTLNDCPLPKLPVGLTHA
jgi:hypothetical protein